MTLQEYAEVCRATMMRRTHDNNEDAFYFAACLAGEAGELVNEEKKVLRHGWEVADVGQMISEAGDILWYLQAYCLIRGITLEHVMEANIQKLQERYPDGFKSSSR